MHKQLHVAVIGAGIAGLALSLFLNNGGHRVTLIEKFPNPQAVGAGLVLQPSGLQVLKALGLLDSICHLGAKITKFVGRDQNDINIFSMNYEKLSSQLFAIGVHRHAIFQILFDQVINNQIPIVSNFTACSISEQRGKHTISDLQGKSVSGFDMVVDASGANSLIREKYGPIKRKTELNYGALWTVLKKPGQYQNYDSLRQWIFKARSSIGLIPVGTAPGVSEGELVALHWSISNKDFENWRREPIEKWKAKARQLCPEFCYLEDQVFRHSNFIHANYRQVILKNLSVGKIIFIGDAGHAMSPRLGQGANLALMDAWFLAICIGQSANINQAIGVFNQRRKQHIAYYHLASMCMGWLFQSNNLITPNFRNLAFRVMSKFNFAHNSMLKNLAGVKTGFFSELDTECFQFSLGERSSLGNNRTVRHTFLQRR